MTYRAHVLGKRRQRERAWLRKCRPRGRLIVDEPGHRIHVVAVDRRAGTVTLQEEWTPPFLTPFVPMTREELLALYPQRDGPPTP